MIGYATIGVSDVERARAYYDALFAEVDRAEAWLKAHGTSLLRFGVTRPAPQREASNLG